MKFLNKRQAHYALKMDGCDLLMVFLIWLLEYNRTHEHSPLAKYWASLLLFGAPLNVQLVGKSLLFWHPYGFTGWSLLNSLSFSESVFNNVPIKQSSYATVLMELKCRATKTISNSFLQFNEVWILRRLPLESWVTDGGRSRNLESREFRYIPPTLSLFLSS